MIKKNDQLLKSSKEEYCENTLPIGIQKNILKNINTYDKKSIKRFKKFNKKFYNLKFSIENT